MSKKLTNKEEPLKTFLQDRFEDYKHPVRDDLWSTIEQDLFVEKKPSTTKKAFFISLAVAASLILGFLAIPSFEAETPAIVNKTETPKEVAPISKPQIIEELVMQTSSIPELTAVADKSNKRTVRKQTLNSTIETDTPPTVTETGNQPNLSRNEEDSVVVRKKNPRYESLLSPNDSWIEPISKKKSNVSLALIAMGSLNAKTDPSNRVLVMNTNLEPQENGERSIKYDYPINVGFLVRKNLTRNLSLETGLSYTYLSSKEEVKYKLNPNTDSRIKLHYLGIPVKVNYAVYENKGLSVYGSLGGMVEKLISGKNEMTIGNKRETKNIKISELQWSMSASVGINYKLTGSWGIFVEPGVAYFFDDNSDVETIRKDKPVNFNVQGGIRFSY